MLAEKASKKAPKEVKNENKKPPVKVVEQKESSKSQKTVKDLVKEEKYSSVMTYTVHSISGAVMSFGIKHIVLIKNAIA